MGSIEELWAFNEEMVARAIFKSEIPIISAVGHETDFTIADFVADLRAPTPTAAAELAAPNIIELQEKVLQRTLRLQRAMRELVHKKKKNYKYCKNLMRSVIQDKYMSKRRAVDRALEQLVLEKSAILIKR